MQKILPAVLMLCALAAGSHLACAATDNQLMREEITAGMTDPAVIEESADAFGFSGEKAKAYADFIAILRQAGSFSTMSSNNSKRRAWTARS